ncbi:MAG: hypothetical protein AAGN35_02485 [Bacteroidota bacterium]
MSGIAIPAQDHTHIQVHFLYGSTPRKAYKDTERKWFGGRLGGHVGVELDSGRIVNFVPKGSYHVFARKKDLHGRWMVHAPRMFWQVLGNQAEDVKKTTITIPVTPSQWQAMDSLTKCYLDTTPYDYAFLGMRCAAATYDLLATGEVLPAWSYGKTWRKMFYPRKLRKRLLLLAREQGWPIRRDAGTERRKWERDVGRSRAP